MAARKNIFFLIMAFLFMKSIAAQVPPVSILNRKAPETFRVLFKTTKGDFTIEAYRKWSPLGVDRLYQLVKTGFYNNTSLFRVEPGFVTQFGISDIRAINRFWDHHKLPDEPILAKNEKGVICYARGGTNDRTTQLFINNVNNPLLDTVIRAGLQGYTPVARVIKGMEVALQFYSRYGRSTLAIQDSVYKYGNVYLEKNYPGLDKILWAGFVR